MTLISFPSSTMGMPIRTLQRPWFMITLERYGLHSHAGEAVKVSD